VTAAQIRWTTMSGDGEMSIVAARSAQHDSDGPHSRGGGRLSVHTARRSDRE